MKLSDKIKQIQISPTMEVAAEAARLKQAGTDIINLIIGEPDFPTPENIKSAAVKALDSGFTKYTENQGFYELRSAVRNKYRQEYNLNYSEDEIIISNGAKQAVFNAVQSIISEGDEVIIPAPFYVSYPHIVKLAGGNPVIVNTPEKTSFKLNPEILENSITEKTRALILCNPNNPTGTVYSEKELKEIMTVVKKYDLFVISDEIYEKLVFDDLNHNCLTNADPEYKEKIVIINGMSKTYAMTGWRIGYALSDKKIISAMSKIQSHSTSGANSISQIASIEALTGSQKSVELMKQEFELRRNFLCAALNEIDGISCCKSSGAFYLFPNVKSFLGKEYKDQLIKNSNDVALFLLKEAQVAVVPGNAFGMDGYLRFSYAASVDELKKAISNLDEAVKKLR